MTLFIITLITILILFKDKLNNYKDNDYYQKPENWNYDKKPINNTYNERYEKIINGQRIHSENRNEIKWTKEFLSSLEWKRYEEVCTEYLKIKNCDANVTSIGADGGMDIKIKDKNGKLFAIGQCKSWSKPIGVSLIRELYGIMVSEDASYAIFLTTSKFSLDAIAFAQNKKMILIDADEFIHLINKLNELDKKKLSQIATKGDYTTPTCVNCDVKMIKKTAKKGTSEESVFWGCINFPRCRKTMFIKNTDK